MRAFVLGSGSSGNSLLVEADGVRILVDAGLGPRNLEARLLALGVPLLPHGIDAIVPTHHHGDHFGGVEKLARFLECPVYLHPGIEAPRVRSRFKVVEVEMGRASGSVASRCSPSTSRTTLLRSRCASRPRTMPSATRPTWGGSRRGSPRCSPRVTSRWFEANHCSEMLAYGPYPTHLRHRVSGGLGHLSNTQTAELAAKLVGSRLGQLYLGHLSRSNNTPERALETVAEAARRMTVSVLPHGSVCALDVKRSSAFQLALPF